MNGSVTSPADPLLATRVRDNEQLHGVYSLLGTGSWEEGVRAALAAVTSLRARSPHDETRMSCEAITGALSGLDALAGRGDDMARALRQAEVEANLPTTPRRERVVLMVRQQLLRHLMESAASPRAGIPRLIHLVRTDDRPDDLPLVQYLCYRSVLAQCSGYRVLLHTPAVPRGERWAALLRSIEVRIGATPQWLGSHRLVAAAHQSDVWRLKHLIDHGGFYFDWDVLLLRPPEGLRSHVCVMAIERQEPGYHEVMGVSAIGAMPQSVFLRAWLDAMPSVFNPGRYVSHSTVLARELALRLPALVRVLDYRTFYDPGWSAEAMQWLFDPALRLPEDELRARLSAAIGMHLFCSHQNFLQWGRGMTERDVEAGRSNLALLMRPYL